MTALKFYLIGFKIQGGVILRAVSYRNSEELKKYLDDAYGRFTVMVKKFNSTKEK